MKFLSKYDITLLKQALGKNRELRDSLEALEEGSYTGRDIDLIYEELDFLYTNKKDLLYPLDLKDVNEVLGNLRDLE